LQKTLEETSHAIEQLREHFSGSVTERGSMITEHINNKTRMGKKISQRKAQTQILKEALNSIGFAREHGEGGELFADEILRG
jgi:ferritin-like metal-binding protein YciE